MNPPANMVTEEDVIWHTLMVGKTGSGKSNGIEYWMLRLFDRRDVAIVFVDPAGDAALDLVRRIDRKDWPRVALLDPREVTFGLNPLTLPPSSTPEERTEVMERQVDELSVLLSDVFNTDSANAPRLMWILKGALYFLYGGRDSPTFYELYDLLTFFMNHSKEENASMLRGGRVNEGIIQSTIEAISQLPKEAFSAVINRISNFVLPPKSVTSRTFCSTESKIDFARMTEPGRLTIFRPAGRNLSDAFRQVFSATVIMKLYFTSLRRANKLEKEGKGEEARTPIVLVIDEFQNVNALKIVDTILSQARKFGLFLWMAFTYLTLVRKDLLSSILGNVGPMFVYLVSSDDASVFAEVLFPGKEKEGKDAILKLTRGWCFVRKNPIGGSGVARTLEVKPHPKVREPVNSITDVTDFMHNEMEKEYGGAVESTAIGYRSTVEQLWREREDVVFNPVKFRILTMAYLNLMKEASALEYSQLVHTLFKRYEWKESVVHGALADLVMGGLLDERFDYHQIYKGRDDFGNAIYADPDHAKKDEMERARTSVYSLTNEGKTLFLQKVGSSRVGNPVHLRAIMKLLEERYWPMGSHCVVDFGKEAGEKPDIAVFHPATVTIKRKDGTEVKAPDPYAWDSMHGLAVEVEEYPSKHPDRVLKNYSKNRPNYSDILFVVTMPEQVGDIHEILDRGGVDPVTYRTEVIPFQDLNRDDAVAEGAKAKGDEPGASPTQMRDGGEGAREPPASPPQETAPAVGDPEAAPHHHDRRADDVPAKKVRAETAEALILWHIANNGFEDRETVASACHTSPRSVTRHLRDLEEKGLIVREGNRIVASPKGLDVLNTARKAHAAKLGSSS